MPFQIVRNDLTKMCTQAVVNAANEHLRQGGGVCGAIFNAAGADELSKECDKIGFCPTGSAVITKGFNLSDYVIHTVGPVWRGGLFGEEKKLYSCYETSLKLAYDNKIESIAFPLISAGIYGYPQDKAIKIAVDAITSSTYLTEIDIYLVLFDKNAVFQGNKYSKVQEYIDDNYIDSYPYARSVCIEDNYSQPICEYDMAPCCIGTIEDEIKLLDESFSESLLRLIDERGLVDSAVYKKANIDRKLFSKIKNNKDYKPRKNTVIAFAIALELNVDETNNLLAKAGYVLSHSNKSDIIIEYFIKKKNYKIFEINEALFAFDQGLLGV